jgi:hypothetical protein
VRLLPFPFLSCLPKLLTLSLFTDRDYRSGIFQLETLRMQKSRVNASARETLREFVLELGTTLRETFEQRIVDHVSFGQAQVAVRSFPLPSSFPSYACLFLLFTDRRTCQAGGGKDRTGSGC